jgi:hypothetical protein
MEIENIPEKQLLGKIFAYNGDLISVVKVKVKVKFPCALPGHHAMKAYRGVEV